LSVPQLAMRRLWGGAQPPACATGPARRLSSSAPRGGARRGGACCCRRWRSLQGVVAATLDARATLAAVP